MNWDNIDWIIGFIAIVITLIAIIIDQKKKGTKIQTSEQNKSIEDPQRPSIEDTQKQENLEQQNYSQSYQAKYLLTPNEWHEHKKLQKLAAERGLVICPKVRLLDIIEPRKGAANYKSLFYKVQAKHVDFVICDRAMHIKAVLELDDNSHNQKDRQERDAFVDQILTSVGYKVIRTHSITETTLDCISTEDSDPAITQEEI